MQGLGLLVDLVDSPFEGRLFFSPLLAAFVGFINSQPDDDGREEDFVKEFDALFHCSFFADFVPAEVSFQVEESPVDPPLEPVIEIAEFHKHSPEVDGCFKLPTLPVVVFGVLD